MRTIDADALIKRLGIADDCSECDKNKSPYCTWKPDVVDVCEAICDAPTIEPERKKGKWITQDFNKHYGMTTTAVYYYPKCSICGESANYTNFCPNCGSNMREGDQDD